MILRKSFRDEILEYITGIPEEIYSQHGISKQNVLADNEIIERLWINYQKDVEEYGCDEDFSMADAVFEVLGIPI